MLELSQGNTYTLTFSIVNKDGSPKDLSGSLELKYKLAKRKTLPPIIELNLADADITISDPITGEVKVTLDSSMMNSLGEGSHYHELWHINALGEPNTLMSSKLIINSKLIKE